MIMEVRRVKTDVVIHYKAFSVSVGPTVNLSINQFEFKDREKTGKIFQCFVSLVF